jgi:hypothetical protein
MSQENVEVVKAAYEALAGTAGSTRETPKEVRKTREDAQAGDQALVS